jgi:pSer/pThr/pTyr-binding forkhead associated (FHA) protein
MGLRRPDLLEITSMEMVLLVFEGTKADMTLKLLVIQGRPSGKNLVFPSGDYFIGRGPECHVRPESDWVSRQHCMLRVTGEGAFVRDLGSRNGTLVNGSLVLGERLLDEGDHLQVGPLVFEVHLEEEVVEKPPSLAEAGAVTLGSALETKRDKDIGLPDNLDVGGSSLAFDETRSSPALAPTDPVELTPESASESRSK